MEIDIKLLQKSSLFKDISEKGIREALSLTGYTVRKYGKGEALIMHGYEAREVGILLSGELEAAKCDINGSRFIVAHIKPCDVFGDVLSVSSYAKSPVNVSAICSSCAVFIPTNKLYVPAFPASSERLQILHNLTCEIANKYFALDSRLELVLEKSLRMKIIHYLKMQLNATKCNVVTIGFTRTALAEYLGCERTALARELTRMQKDGIIKCDKKEITVINKI
ncbi:MAG: Crp/Fnr family transcriptional regulator [Oscillospiraceae bacterium]